MSVGLIALLDDVATLAQTAAATLDDIAGQAARAGTKSAGVVIDDAAVTPRYVVGFSADRELPIVMKIAKGSLINKLLVLLPAALALSLFAPWAITPLLMLGGLYLCYEGAEKVYELLLPEAAHAHEIRVLEAADAKILEDLRVKGAIQTDFILSAEIMAIALATVADEAFLSQAIVLALVGLFITLGVYGAVALIVRADDFGVSLARRPGAGEVARATRLVGRALVRSMPGFLKALSAVGTAAMVWVGGGIVIHGLAAFGVAGPEHLVHAAGESVAIGTGVLASLLAWLAGAAISGVFGLLVGGALIPLVGKVLAPAWRRIRRRRTRKEVSPS